MDDKEYLEEVEKYGASAKGKKELVNYLKTGKISLRQAVYSKCYDCCGFYVDGRLDCTNNNCPLYPFMPYNPNKAKGRRGRKLTEEQIENFRKNISKEKRGRPPSK